MQLAIHDWVGLLGAFLILLTFFLLQLGKLKSIGPVYSILNALGALCIIVSLLFEFNLSAMVMQISWLLISSIGIIRYLRARRTAGGATETQP